jgi:hypothetical protein
MRTDKTKTRKGEEVLVQGSYSGSKGARSRSDGEQLRPGHQQRARGGGRLEPVEAVRVQVAADAAVALAAAARAAGHLGGPLAVRPQCLGLEELTAGGVGGALEAVVVLVAKVLEVVDLVLVEEHPYREGMDGCVAPLCAIC